MAGVAAVGVLGFPIGVATTLALGYSAWGVFVPALGIAFCYVLARGALPPRLAPLAPAFAVQGGHLIWLMLSVLAGRWGGLLLDTVPLAAGLVWLARQPGRNAAYFLTGIHVFEILLHLTQLAGEAPDSDGPVWIAAHIALRALAVGLMWRGLRRLARRGPRVSARPAS